MNEVVERFWAKVDVTSDGCWGWTGAHHERGYGRFRLDGRVEYAHRAAWLLANGPIPDGMCVLHRCDNPPCVNPAHLFLGTNADNTADMMAKGREKMPVTVGEANGRANLTEADVRAIRSRVTNGETQASLAREYALGSQHVSMIVNRVLWASVS